MMLRSLTIIVMLLLAGCGSYRPLYSSAPDGSGVAASLSSISVPEQRTRTGQLLRNELLSGLGNGGASLYNLNLAITESTGGVAATPGTVVTRKRFNLSVRYELVDITKGGTITSGTSFANVSYDTVREPVADLQAADNARVRATTQVGQDIRQRLAAFIANHKS
jgi:LPS-assembly lipoprotein